MCGSIPKGKARPPASDADFTPVRPVVDRTITWFNREYEVNDMKTRTEIAPGICNFDAIVTAETEDSQNVTFEFETECQTIKEFADQLSQISPVDAIATLGPEENPVLAIGRKLLQTKGCCDACIVPAATAKIMQVAAGLALPKDVSLTIARE